MQVLTSDDTKINQGLTKPEMAMNYATKNPQVSSYSSSSTFFSFLSLLFFLYVCYVCCVLPLPYLKKKWCTPRSSKSQKLLADVEGLER
jgi:hypothetical protein